MAYTIINKSSEHFNTKLYTGNGGTQSITGLDFQPDWVAIKDRGATNSFMTFDAVRGATKLLNWNTTNAESTQTPTLTSFNSDGFSIGNNTALNTNNNNLVAWNWKETATAGFDIVSYTGNGSNRTISHSLSAVPKMMIIKNRTATSGDRDWSVYHQALGNGSFCLLNTDDAKDDSSGFFNNTTPTSSVFTVGTNTRVNANSDTFIAYLFAEKQGYSKFGSYTGNGNSGVNGPFINTGFKPAFVILKESTNAQSWMLYDNKRLGYNDGEKYFIANTDAAETINSDYHIDFLSNGIKILGNTNDINRNNGNYIYMCFGQSIVGSNNIPCTAR